MHAATSCKKLTLRSLLFLATNKAGPKLASVREFNLAALEMAGDNREGGWGGGAGWPGCR